MRQFEVDESGYSDPDAKVNAEANEVLIALTPKEVKDIKEGLELGIIAAKAYVKEHLDDFPFWLDFTRPERIGELQSAFAELAEANNVPTS